MRRYTFLNTRDPKEAWRTVLEALRASEFNMAQTAKRLSISRTAFYTWLNRTDGLREKLDAERKRFFEQ